MSRIVELFDPATRTTIAQTYDDEGNLTHQECRVCRRNLPAVAFLRARRPNTRPGDKRGTCFPCTKAARRAKAREAAK